MSRLNGITSLFLIGCLAFTQPGQADMALNPDVRPDTLEQTICVVGYTKSIRPSTSFTNGLKFSLLREAGLAEAQAGEYELDHLVPLAVGGHPRSLDNLKLQPWPDAKRKDRLEAKLQCLVCTGQVPLAEAQRAIYEDWQAAYHRYATVKCRRTKQDKMDSD